MNYVKSCLIITMLLGIGYSQCDANGDGDLNVQDVVVNVNCILTPGCWDGEPVCEDIDGNVYETIQIGEQLWMAENLKVTRYKDSTPIPTGYSNSNWGELQTGAYSVYPADEDENSIATCGDDCADVYGNLYNWYTLYDSRGVCPEGWHVPSDNEYTILIDYLGGENIAGGKMKEEGLDHWNSPNSGATNESGFTGLPAGFRTNDNGYYVLIGSYGYFWSSSEITSYDAWTRNLFATNAFVSRSSSSKQRGSSIRCLRD